MCGNSHKIHCLKLKVEIPLRFSTVIHWIGRKITVSVQALIILFMQQLEYILCNNKLIQVKGEYEVVGLWIWWFVIVIQTEAFSLRNLNCYSPWKSALSFFHWFLKNLLDTFNILRTFLLKYWANNNKTCTFFFEQESTICLHVKLVD